MADLYVLYLRSYTEALRGAAPAVYQPTRDIIGTDLGPVPGDLTHPDQAPLPKDTTPCMGSASPQGAGSRSVAGASSSSSSPVHAPRGAGGSIGAAPPLSFALAVPPTLGGRSLGR